MHVQVLVTRIVYMDSLRYFYSTPLQQRDSAANHERPQPPASKSSESSFLLRPTLLLPLLCSAFALAAASRAAGALALVLLHAGSAAALWIPRRAGLLLLAFLRV